MHVCGVIFMSFRIDIASEECENEWQQRQNIWKLNKIINTLTYRVFVCMCLYGMAAESMQTINSMKNYLINPAIKRTNFHPYARKHSEENLWERVWIRLFEWINNERSFFCCFEAEGTRGPNKHSTRKIDWTIFFSVVKKKRKRNHRNRIG